MTRNDDLVITLIEAVSKANQEAGRAQQENVRQLAERAAAHEAYCLTREDKAQEMRHDLRDKMQAGFSELHNRISNTNKLIFRGVISILFIALTVSGWALVEIYNGLTVERAVSWQHPPE